MFYARLSYTMLFCSILVCLSLYIFGYHPQVEGEGDDQVLDLALMTNYSQFTFMWTVSSSLSVFA